MWLDSALDILDEFKNNFPASILLFIPLLMAISPVNGAQTFPVYRLNQFEMNGASFGSSGSLVNMEARSLDSSGAYNRRCVVMRLAEITLERYRAILEQNAGALVIMLPTELQNLSEDLKKEFFALESALLSEDTDIPVYFTIETEEIREIYEQIRASSHADGKSTATQALLQSVSANGFLLNVNVNTPKKLSGYKALNIHGVLEGSGSADRLPTVLFVAHYDAAGISPSLSQGADSNGSGVAALLELMRVFSRMYSVPANRPDHNLAFLLSGAGKLNYFGTKRWLEELKDSSRFPYLSDVDVVICLDSIGRNGKLYAHVSKPPKEESPGDLILKNLEGIAQLQGFSTELKHKKISLKDPLLAWEHEQFAMNKLPGITFSSLESHIDPLRTSALDTKSSVSLESLTRNTYTVGEAVGKYLFNMNFNKEISSTQILSNDLAVQSTMIEAWLDLITSQPRAAQLFHAKHSLISSFEQAFQRHLKSVEVTAFEGDRRDPEFILYGNNNETMHVYNVKPAVFDLVLAACIAGYLGLFYLASLAFPMMASLFLNKTKKA